MAGVMGSYLCGSLGRSGAEYVSACLISQAAEFYSSIKGEPFFGETIDFMTSDVVRLLSL